MRTRKRLEMLKQWTQESICTGRRMKAPGPNGSYLEIKTQEPKCYLGFFPAHPDATAPDMLSTAPSVLIMPLGGSLQNMEEKRFDRYSGIRRPQEMGQGFQVSVLFSVYEPGVRLPGFNNGGRIDTKKILEGTEEGIFALTDWMDEFKEKLLKAHVIPGSDLILDTPTATYAPLQDGGYVVDKRPIYYGMVTATFQCHADDNKNDAVEALLI